MTDAAKGEMTREQLEQIQKDGVNIFVVRRDELYLSHEPRHRVYAEQWNVVKLEDYAALRQRLAQNERAIESYQDELRSLKQRLAQGPMTDAAKGEIKVYHKNIGGIFQGEEKFIEVIAKTDYDALAQRLAEMEGQRDELRDAVLAVCRSKMGLPAVEALDWLRKIGGKYA